jgi:glycosyltransferase involved in cell wall biosynthesis
LRPLSAYDPAVASPPRCAILPPVPVPYRQPLFARLVDRGRIAPTVVYLSGGQPGWDQRADWFPAEHPYPVEVLGARQRARPGRSPVLLPRELGRALNEVDPACVVSWEFGASTLRSLAWCRRRGRPLVIFSELTPQAARELSAIRRAVHRVLAPRAAGFIAASSRAKGRIVELGIDPERVEVSLQSADVERFHAVGGREHAGPVRVLSAGRLVPDKNLGALIEAFAEAGLDDGEAELELCGTGPLEGELRAAAERLGIPLRLRGYAAPEELPDVYAEADLFALVSTYEPFGVAVREAAAAGLPIICTRVAGAAGDVAREGENALLTDPCDSAQIAGAIRRLVRDPALRARMGRASLAITATLSPEADAEAFERAVLRATARS